VQKLRILAVENLLFYPTKCATVFLNATWGFACETGSSAVSESNTNIGRLDTRHNKHWSGRNPTKRRCRVCSARGVTRTVMFSERHDANGDVQRGAWRERWCSARDMTRTVMFSEGHDANWDVQMCQVRRGAFCGPKLFCVLPHTKKKTLIRPLFVRPPWKQLKPRSQC